MKKHVYYVELHQNMPFMRKYIDLSTYENTSSFTVKFKPALVFFDTWCLRCCGKTINKYQLELCKNVIRFYIDVPR